MKVKDLIAQLQLLEPDTEVLVARDAEGNAYRALSEVDDAWCIRDGHEYEVYSDDRNGGTYCAVLYPV